MVTFNNLSIILIGLIISCSSERKIEVSLEVGDRIFDNSYLLSQSQKDSIFTLIDKLDREIGSQIAVLTIDTLGKEKLEEFSLRMANELGLGRSTHDDGLLITVVALERKMRIEVGTGLENIVRDEIAARILREDMAPLFSEGKFAQGIYLAVDKISKLIIENKELVGTPPK